MIVTSLHGGLGNQMFQYAAGLYLAKKHKVECLIDISIYKTYKLHPYLLNFFNISENYANYELPNKYKYVKESKAAFGNKLISIPDNVILEGYWQSLKYFDGIEKKLQKQFVLKDQLSGINKQIAEEIKSSNSLSIHIRRGSYLYESIEILDPLDLSYYIDCLKFMNKLHNNLNIFVFSDEIDWVKHNFVLPHNDVKFIENNSPYEAYEDLRLMSLCKHNVIANSTFSWWAAWLNSNENKVVCAPKNWFSRKTKYLSTKDFLPSSWEII